ncbi:OprD family porin [Pseudomonas protegens]|uniref:OprD family porin n=1 Tax=Pseudomonas TaxID=286 RepID=UPI000C99C5CB|nr:MULTISPECIES: OprD family porin [Pseudomonas]MBW8352944.1 OprD family porin [Pseudomonas sp.]MDP4568938.1 OprD family porin [Pseudomonas sp. LPH60]PNG37231.1 porin [Pseudomonas protegens]BCT35021.1 porin [Pseudomonas protegens]
MRVMKWSMIALAVSAGTSQFAIASSQDDAKGFIEDSTLTAKTRAMYMNRDYKDGVGNVRRGNGTYTTGTDDKTSGYRQDTGISELLNYQSGFTQGTVGVGVDAMAMGSVKLDGGAGRAGNGLFATNGSGEPENTQSKLGAAAKFRISDTVLKYGNQFVSSPVFTTDDGRLLPEVATGTLITSNEIKGLELSAGRFTALSAQTGMGRDSINGRSRVTGKQNPGLSAANIAGFTYSGLENFIFAVHASDVEDYWKKQYVNVNYTLPLSDKQSLNFDFNGYRSKDDGKKLAGDLDNRVWSLAAAYSIEAHKFTLAFQQSAGKTGYNYGVDGGGTVYVANSVQISDFVGEDEKSWQARYDLNMASFGVPGLSFMTRYIRGSNVTVADSSDGKEHEWDVEAKYVLQEGPAKDLSFRLRNAIYRGTNSDYRATNYDNLNDLRLIVEYPLSIL